MIIFEEGAIKTPTGIMYNASSNASRSSQEI